MYEQEHLNVVQANYEAFNAHGKEEASSNDSDVTLCSAVCASTRQSMAE